MNEQLITAKIQELHAEPEKQELLFFLDYLLAKQNKVLLEVTKKTPKFGSGKGTFKMKEDFDVPNQ